MTITVKDIADELKVSEETVRRWVRTGKLKGTKSSKKEGFVIFREDYLKFTNNYPKYRRPSIEHELDYIKRRFNNELEELKAQKAIIENRIKSLEEAIEKLG